LREAGFEMELTLKLEIGLRPQSDEGEAADLSEVPSTLRTKICGSCDQ